MRLLLRDTLLKRKPLVSLARALYRDKEALLQILLSLSEKTTFDRIEGCPTYPARTVTSDLEERLTLFQESVAPDPFAVPFVFAVLYESATTEHVRKRLGQYFTPLQVAKEAIELLAVRPYETVLDPGCGTGIFPVTLLREDVTKPFRYVGIENDPIMALSTAISLEVVNAPKDWKVLYANFLKVEAKDMPQIDAVIANPPFVRSHKLGGKEEFVKGLNLSGRAGFHSYFLAYSSELVEKGRMVFIVPIEMNSTLYGSSLIGRLQERFESSSKIVYLNSKSQTWSVEDLRELTLEKHTKIRQVWTLMTFHPKSHADARGILKSKEERAQMQLKAIASVHRGISTGANRFFVITDQSAKKNGITKRYLKKVIPSRIPKGRLPDVFGEADWENLKKQGKPCWLICLPRNIPEEELPVDVRQYLKKGEREGIHLVPTCKNRERWYYIDASPKRIPDLVFTYISRGYPRFIYNEARAHILTNFLGVYLEPSGPPVGNVVGFIRLLNDELRKWIDRESAGRKYAGGLVKFEPSDLARMPISQCALENLGLSYSYQIGLNQ